jgi:polyphosphate kinase
MAEDLFNDRDISWLSFNKRVLHEILFPDLKIYDKIKFLAIHSNNLDEFSRVRMAQLEMLAGKENLPDAGYFSNILKAVRKEANKQSLEARIILEKLLIPELKTNGIILYYAAKKLSKTHKEEALNIFMSKVLTYLQPVILDEKTNIFLEDRLLYFLVQLTDKRTKSKRYMILNIPSHIIPRLYTLSPQNGKKYFIYLDDIIRIGTGYIMKKYAIGDLYAIKLNRNAEINIDEEQEGLIDALQKGVQSRKMGNPSRFQYDAKMPPGMIAFCREKFNLESGEMLPVGRYMNMSDFFALPNPGGSKLLQKPLKPLKHPSLSLFGNYFKAISRRDFLFHFPYQTYDHVLVFFNQAVLDPYVTEIMITFYRIAHGSYVVNALISAAKNGKKVKAFVELKARFDEANNIYWAKKMAEAGVEISYSIPGIKVHAKAALIKRKVNGKEQQFGFFGTGNFNEKTSGTYSDIGLLSADPRHCTELESVFNYLFHRKQPEAFETLIVPQFGGFEKFMALIDNEISIAKTGEYAEIWVKVNNLEDPEIIQKLYDASSAGVKVKLCVRSICRIKPGVPGLSEHISVCRVVGSYLEHSRIFIFHNQGKQDMYLGSADWMTRNMKTRIEVVFPILNLKIKKEVLKFMEIQFTPSVKTQMLDADLQPIPYPERPAQYCAQVAFHTFLKTSSKKKKTLTAKTEGETIVS